MTDGQVNGWKDATCCKIWSYLMANNIVEEWLASLKLHHYAQAFIDNGYDDLEICKQIGEEDLDAIGVWDAGERSALLQAVEQLRRQGGACVYFTLDEPPEPPAEDSYVQGKRALSWTPVLQVAAIHERLSRDKVDLTDPTLLQSEDLSLKLEGLAKKYASELDICFKDVLNHLQEICKTQQGNPLRNEDDYADIDSENTDERWRESDTNSGHQGDLRASDITMSEEERIQLLVQVKEKRITMQDALQRVKKFEDERRPSLPENLNVSSLARVKEELPCKSSSSSSLFSRLTSFRRKSKSEDSSSAESSPHPHGHLSVIRDINISDPQGLSTTADYEDLDDVAVVAAHLRQGEKTSFQTRQSVSCTNSPKRTRRFFKTSKSSDEPLNQLSGKHSTSTDDRKSFVLHSPFSRRKKLSTDISGQIPGSDDNLQGSPTKDQENLKQEKGKKSKESKEKGKSKDNKEKNKQTKEKEKIKDNKDKSKEIKIKITKEKVKDKDIKGTKEKAKDKGKAKQGTLGREKGKKAVTAGDRLKVRKLSTGSSSSSSSVYTSHGVKQAEPTSKTSAAVTKATSSSEKKRHASGSRIPAPLSKKTNGDSDSYSETERHSSKTKPHLPQDSTVNKAKQTSKLESPSILRDTSNEERKDRVKSRHSLSRDGNRSSGDESNRSSTSSRLPVKSGDTPPRSPTYRILPKIKTERVGSSGSHTSINSQCSVSSVNRNVLRSPSRSPVPSPTWSPARSPNLSPSLSPTKRHSSPLLQPHKKQLLDYPSSEKVLQEYGISKSLECSNRQTDPVSPSPFSTSAQDQVPTLQPNQSFLHTKTANPVLRPHPVQSGHRHPKAFSSLDSISRKKGEMFTRDSQISTTPTSSRHSLSERVKDLTRDVKRRFAAKLRNNKASSSVDILDGCEEDEEPSMTNEKEVTLQPAFSPMSTSSSPSSMSVEEEDPVHKGPFVGRARVLRNYTPSPYDREALTLKQGELIQIISKHESGIWRGVVNNKEGTFKFINVEVLPEEKSPVPRVSRMLTRNSSRQHSRRRPRAKTVEELMQRLGLQDLTGVFLFNGFESLEHFSEIEEDDLNELCINNPEHRAKILTAAQMIRDYEGCDGDSEPPMSPAMSRSVQATEDDNSVSNMNLNRTTNSQVVRDSGCYPSMEGLQHGEFNHVETIVITQGPEITCRAISQSGTQTTFIQPMSSPKSILKHREGWPLLSENTGTRSLPASPNRSRPQGQRVNQITGSPLASRSPSMSPQRGPHHILSSSAHVSPIRTPRPNSPDRHVFPSYSSSSGMSSDSRRAPYQPPPVTSQFKPTVPERSSSLSNKLTPISGTTVAHLADEIPWPLHKDYAKGHLHLDNMNTRTMSSPNINLKDTPPGSPFQKLKVASVDSTPQRISRHDSLLSWQKPRQVSLTLEILIKHKIDAENIDLTSQPYTDRCGFCGIPLALVQRYAEELDRETQEVAKALDECRVRLLQQDNKLAVPNDFLGEAALQPLQDVSTSSLQDFLVSVGLPMYIDNLYTHNTRSLEAVLNMGDQDLLHCGITNQRHRERLTTARDLLRIKMPTLARPTVTRKLSEVRDKV